MKRMLNRISSVARSSNNNSNSCMNDSLPPPSYEQAVTEHHLKLKMGKLGDIKYSLCYLCVTSYDNQQHGVDNQRTFLPVEVRHAMKQISGRLLAEQHLCQTPKALAAVEAFLLNKGKLLHRWPDSSKLPPMHLQQIADTLSGEMPLLAGQVQDVRAELEQLDNDDNNRRQLRRRHSLVRIDVVKLRRCLVRSGVAVETPALLKSGGHS